MPEMHGHIRGPDGRREACDAPSLVVKEFRAAGASDARDDCVEKARTALTFARASAMAQRARIEAAAKRQNPGGLVTVETFES